MRKKTMWVERQTMANSAESAHINLDNDNGVDKLMKMN